MAVPLFQHSRPAHAHILKNDCSCFTASVDNVKSQTLKSLTGTEQVRLSILASSINS